MMETMKVDAPVGPKLKLKTALARQSFKSSDNPESGRQLEESKGRILVVDDEQPILDLMRDVLTGEGYEVATEHNGYRAMLRVREHRFDLIFMDIKMPVNGVVAVKEILDMRPDTAVVMITGYADNELIDQALAYGARMCLMKPFTLDRIIAVTAEILSHEA